MCVGICDRHGPLAVILKIPPDPPLEKGGKEAAGGSPLADWSKEATSNSPLSKGGSGGIFP
jgi:hypothetical protein